MYVPGQKEDPERAYNAHVLIIDAGDYHVLILAIK
jgi:hypothetical protein